MQSAASAKVSIKQVSIKESDCFAKLASVFLSQFCTTPAIDATDAMVRQRKIESPEAVLIRFNIVNLR